MVSFFALCALIILKLFDRTVTYALVLLSWVQIKCSSLLIQIWNCVEIFTVRNSSCGKVMFSQASVILSTGGSGRHPPDTPWADTPWADIPSGQTPSGQTSLLGRHSLPGADTLPGQTTPRQTPPGRRPLLECILICNKVAINVPAQSRVVVENNGSLCKVSLLSEIYLDTSQKSTTIRGALKSIRQLQGNLLC